MSTDSLLTLLEDMDFIAKPCCKKGCNNWFFNAVDTLKYMNGDYCECGNTFCKECSKVQFCNDKYMRCQNCRQPKILRKSIRKSFIRYLN